MAATRLKTTKDGRAYYEIRYRTSREASELSTRWYVPSGWSEKAIQRELAKQAAEFERQCRAGLIISHRKKKEIAAQEAARQAAEAAKIVTVKQYGERVFMPGKLAGTIGNKALSENSRAYYQNALDTHIYPIIGERKMQEITRAELEALLLGELNSGKSESTISAVYVTLRQIFESAEDSELIRSNPMQKVKKPRRNKADTKDTAQVEAFSIEEMQHILECLKNEPLKWQAYIALMVDTGCRRGEICGLRWQSVNFKDKTIAIENNLVYTSVKKGGKGVFEDTPKTDASARVIDISDDAADLLRRLRIEQSRDCISPYVFSQDGRAEPMHPTSPTRYFKKFGERYGIDHFHPHTAHPAQMQESAQNLFCLDVPEFVVSCVQGLGDGEILIRGYQYTGHALSVSIRFCRSIQTAWRTDFTGNRREAVETSGDTLAFSAPHAKIMTFIIRL